MAQDPHQLLRIALAGFGDIEEWKLGDPARAAALGYPRVYPAELLDDYGTLFVDVVLDARSGDCVCHEVNGPNGVGTDALTGDSALRAELEARQTLHRAEELGLLSRDAGVGRPFVALHAHQHWGTFRTGGEFYPRIDRFVSQIAERAPGAGVRLRSAWDELGDEQISVVVGDVPSVAQGVSVAPNGRLRYQGRPVAFIGNPNLAPELVRTRKLGARAGRVVGADLRVFHAWRLLPLIHDKARQQDLFAGSGIRPLAHFEAYSLDEALDLTQQQLVNGPVVLKPNGTSGGAGIHVVVPEHSDAEIRARIAAVLGDCVAKYGENAEASALPIRGFEFVRATGYPMADGEHLWDLRIAVLFEPGRAFVYPVSLRIAPAPFDPKKFHLDRDQWISNVTTRDRMSTLLLSGMDGAALTAVGMTPDRLEAAFEASLHWTLKAWDLASRAGGSEGAIHEDVCERDDASFYPREKFRV